jgi:hypothetical protein
MTDVCYRKCITTYAEPEITKGESTCAERCTYKFLEAHVKIFKRVEAIQKSMLEQELFTLQEVAKQN